MTNPRIATPARWRMAFAMALSAVGLLAQAASPSSAQSSPSAVARPASAAPVERLIIQYRAGAQDRRGSVVAAGARDAQATASALVSQTAGRALAPGLRYVKSVSPRLHVAQLDRALPPAEAEALLQRLRSDPAVQSVVIDRRLQRHALPTDPYVTGSVSPYFQWHLQSSASVPGGINAAGAWGGSTGTGVVVAVLDGGYQPHPDLTANLLTSNDHDFIADLWTANDGNQRDVDAQDPGDWVTPADVAANYCDVAEPQSSWHGTHVAGLVGALANGSEGVGVAYGAKVLPVRVLGRCGGYLSDILEGMRWAAGLSTVSGSTLPSPHPQVLSLSLGVNEACDAGTQSVVDEIRAQGVGIVASTGNESGTALTKPANCMGVVAVTAHTRGGVLASYANAGPGVAISAPGGDPWDAVISTWNTGTTVPGSPAYEGMYGTSMATPQVAGVLALMASPARSDLSMATLVALMRGAARSFPNNSYCSNNPGFCGSGLLDAGAAVAAAAAAPLNAPDLDVLQRLDSGQLALGERIDFSVHVRNWGTTAATGVQVTASVTGMDIQSVTAGTAGVSPAHSTTGLSATAGDLAAGVDLVLYVTARITAADGVVTSVARASSDSPEATAINNEHRLVPVAYAPVVTETVVADAGGGCSAAPGGQTDASLPLLLLSALLGVRWWRRPRAEALKRRSPGGAFSECRPPARHTPGA